MQQQLFSSISVASPICWAAHAPAVNSLHHKICTAPDWRKCSRDSSKLVTKSRQLYSAITASPVRLVNASSKSSWTTTSPDTVSDWRAFGWTVVSDVPFSCALVTGVLLSMPAKTGLLRPLAVKCTAIETLRVRQPLTF